MPWIEIHAGDFPPGKRSAELVDDIFGRRLKFKVPRRYFREKVRLDQLASVEIATEESVKRLGGTVGWGAVGFLILGPLGLLAGLIAGGRGKAVTFVATLNDGRKLLATTDSRTYTKLHAATFR